MCKIAFLYDVLKILHFHFHLQSFLQFQMLKLKINGVKKSLMCMCEQILSKLHVRVSTDPTPNKVQMSETFDNQHTAEISKIK
jgi:hypothetical protein